MARRMYILLVQTFVRWASPETAGKWVVLMVASAGAAAGQIQKEAIKEMKKESAHILKWMQSRGLANASNQLNGML